MSDQWLCVFFSDEDLSNGRFYVFLNDFALAYTNADSPEDMALFAGPTRPDGQPHYLTPGAAPHVGRLRSLYAFEPCDAPRRMDILALLVGSDSNWSSVRD